LNSREEPPMADRLRGKVAVISGTGSGQGRAAARAFAREGARIVGCDVNEQGAEETAAMVCASGGEMISLHPIDATGEADIDRWMTAAVEAYGPFDILYNNAARSKRAAIEELTRADYEWVMEHETTLILLAVQRALPVFRERGGGVVINIGSSAGLSAA